MNKTNENDAYAARVRAALAEINRPDYPGGMILWLEHAAPKRFAELTDHLPNQIHQLWCERAPLAEFERVTARFVQEHRDACAIYFEFLGTPGGR